MEICIVCPPLIYMDDRRGDCRLAQAFLYGNVSLESLIEPKMANGGISFFHNSQHSSFLAAVYVTVFSLIRIVLSMNNAKALSDAEEKKQCRINCEHVLIYTDGG